MKQTEANLLMDLEKRVKGGIVEIRTGSCSYPLVPIDAHYKDHRFLLDIHQSSVTVSKITSQQRVHTSIVLSRLDINGSRHTNPIYDPQTIPANLNNELQDLMKQYDGYRYDRGAAHLHIYIEGFDERWAFPPEKFGIICGDGHAKIIRTFCERFNISPPMVRSSLL